MPSAEKSPFDDPARCPCAGRNLDKFVQPAVLAVLAETPSPLHGYRIVQRLGKMPMFRGLAPDTAGVYRYLKALEDRDMVKSAWNLSASGPARRLFTLTAAGRTCLARWTATLIAYHDELGQMVTCLRKAARSQPKSATKPRSKKCCASRK
jgi:DNA-binding PadR family transcriptional regulator